ncbi:MAG TPA: response regulator transcription factor [Moorella mulderi]|nr:response regulator transcription factor [Moorella mulderi]
MAKILVVDDEKSIQELIRYNLEKAGHRVLMAEDGASALRLAEETLPDLIILDLMLPGFCGLEVCRRLKSNKTTVSIPIIMLSAKDGEADKVLGLELGAEDYITKPFSPRELLARVKVCLRRLNLSDNDAPMRIKLGPFYLDRLQHKFSIDNRPVRLSPKEFELMHLFLLNAGKVLRREMLLQKIWGYDYAVDTKTVDVHIHYLREKIKPDPASPRYIETVRGVGYRFRDPEEQDV